MRRLRRHRFLFARHCPRPKSFRGLGNVLVLREPIRTQDIIYKVLVMARTVKHGLRTADYGLGIKHGLKYKTRTKRYGLGIKYGLRYETRTEHYGLGIKQLERLILH